MCADGRLLAPADDLLDLLPHDVQADPQLLQHPGRHAADALVGQAEQDMLSTHLVVVLPPGLLRLDDDPPCPIGEPLEHALPPFAC